MTILTMGDYDIYIYNNNNNIIYTYVHVYICLYSCLYMNQSYAPVANNIHVGWCWVYHLWRSNKRVDLKRSTWRDAKSWLARWWGIMFLCERTMNQSKQCLPMNLVSFLFHTRAWHKQRNHHHRPLRALRALRAPAHPDVKWANRLVWKWGVAVQGITMVVSPNPYKLDRNPVSMVMYTVHIYIHMYVYCV